ncbi:MAG: hypothetical protein R3342_03640 [Lutibacter sp.]|uniref:hypothetical protein n=1 Tax=Lutibacter sp. TaxID=1925666 RepID=UPI00299D6CEF|nr:hypothetical protein [Lutibacter sp.]MDX1828619.1 hypothetical protein [Lutibacter sp.]
MKNKLNIFYLITLSLFIYSCSNSNNDRPIGQWDDNIKLSIKDVTFKSTSDSIIITTEGDWWWVIGISINNENFEDFGGIDVTSDNYTIEQNGILIEKRDKNTLFIQADENPLNIERKIIVQLEAGDYFDRVIITQNAAETD